MLHSGKRNRHRVAVAGDVDARGALVDVGVRAGQCAQDGALPMRFKLEVTMPLALGQPVTIVAQNKAQMKGIKVPASSVVKNAANESVVWLHESALLFRAIPVLVSPLDGESVLVLGAPAQARVVTQGATLINQIR